MSFYNLIIILDSFPKALLYGKKYNVEKMPLEDQ